MQKETTPNQPLLNNQWVTSFPFFYGWISLIAGAVAIVMTSPGQTYVVSVLIEPMIAELGISRSLVSILYAIGTIVGGLALPTLGRLIDRYGTRTVATCVAVIAGFSCIYMNWVQNVVMLTIGFILLRLFAHGGLTLSSQNVINQWWIERRGTVMGISGMMFGLIGFGVFPNIVHQLVEWQGWRWAYIWQGIAFFVIMLPVALLLFRSKPEDYGLEPDGGLKQVAGRQVASESDEANSSQLVEENWTMPEATRTPAFWAVSLGVAISGMLITGLLFHIVGIFADIGLSAQTAAFVFVPISIAMAVVNLGSGILVDRIPARLLLSTSLFLLTVAMLIVQSLTGATAAMLYGIGLGISIGMNVVVQGVIWANYFGREHMGSITGVATTILFISNAIGPVPLGIAKDALGSYNLALVLLAILPFVLGVANLFFKKPVKK
ncbi:MAG: MFS transporter [Chloroflexota bacterium]